MKPCFPNAAQCKRFRNLILLCLILTLSGCSDDGTSGPVRTEAIDLTIELTDFLPHIGQYAELRIISEDNRLSARVILDPIDATRVIVKLAKGLPPGPHHVDLFADVNNSGTYDTLPFDHSWRTMIPETGILLLSHDSPFGDIRVPAAVEPAAPFEMKCSGFADQVGRLLEVHVVSVATEQTVGLYRRALIPDSSFQFTVDAILNPGEEYRVDVFVDRNFNFDYDPPPTDYAWRRFGTADGSGLSLDFVFDSMFTDIEL